MAKRGSQVNKHHLPGYVWHITHRCHKREFLLKFEKDKKRWQFFKRSIILISLFLFFNLS
jgi:hypothetical protein